MRCRCSEQRKYTFDKSPPPREIVDPRPWPSLRNGLLEPEFVGPSYNRSEDELIIDKYDNTHDRNRENHSSNVFLFNGKCKPRADAWQIHPRIAHGDEATTKNQRCGARR